MHVYPGIFVMTGLIRSTLVLFDLLSSWSQSIRDKEFLVEMRLRNHEPENSKEKEEGDKTVDNVKDTEAEDSDN
jgi:E3 ubiquitin-protein ligase MARCH6